MRYAMLPKYVILATVFAAMHAVAVPVIAEQGQAKGAPVSATSDEPEAAVEHGKVLAIELCQACHQFEGADQAGTVGPPLLAMKARFPDQSKLQALIYDPQKASKPHTMMPPFGRNGLVNKEDIEHIIAFLYTL